MVLAPSGLIGLLRETKRKLVRGREALLRGDLGAVTAITGETEGLAEQLAEVTPGPLGRNSELSALLTEIRRLGRGNAIIAGEMLRHFRAGLATLQRLETHRSYGPNGGETAATSRRSLGKA
ncbi:MAG TPA: hypothetical protein VET84_06295 [Stellaceae bacterium]|nr:hypothetical protein [Stellaceae bacterium]